MTKEQARRFRRRGAAGRQKMKKRQKIIRGKGATRAIPLCQERKGDRKINQRGVGQWKSSGIKEEQILSRKPPDSNQITREDKQPREETSSVGDHLWLGVAVRDHPCRVEHGGGG